MDVGGPGTGRPGMVLSSDWVALTWGGRELVVAEFPSHLRPLSLCAPGSSLRIEAGGRVGSRAESSVVASTHLTPASSHALRQAPDPSREPTTKPSLSSAFGDPRATYETGREPSTTLRSAPGCADLVSVSAPTHPPPGRKDTRSHSPGRDPCATTLGPLWHVSRRIRALYSPCALVQKRPLVSRV